ncbi:MAG: hypothetical protein COW00_14460 [Bdellovibrio sp. CG12_big_fil_rev_8_21_14_0_65_39_13]|nr:MAG: hypothetical protein COW78_07795 [Bdellovibrio sp. CG22_combo_CG10-13_8_21_14_all_39_27]PIQ58816.1 MAG: hypothetical protein COW00_14460 [Bdellovibrio sp. CG12_big_fil_rev_8_21_14_0_65_39_13]PIR35504.1 MAG: hypothetical protein COV37_08490 [Bdellovibrio sp. CG11_big_fil_rev_8_21_14_0_20_39_38]PJB54067.1 MAG: hypothetical protein CO099_03670 [Bdellovibrio sp. CG_4_9_14_3_um_filter_39_7]
MIIIRSASLNDIPSLVQLEQSCFKYYLLDKKSFSRFIKSKTSELFVAEVGSQIVAYSLMLYRKNSKKARLYSIAVDEKYRKHKIATRLLAFGEELVRQKGMREIALEVQVENTHVIQFYQKHGYIGKKTIPDYYESGQHAERMHKAL